MLKVKFCLFIIKRYTNKSFEKFTPALSHLSKNLWVSSRLVKIVCELSTDDNSLSSRWPFRSHAINNKPGTLKTPLFFRMLLFDLSCLKKFDRADQWIVLERLGIFLHSIILFWFVHLFLKGNREEIQRINERLMAIVVQKGDSLSFLMIMILAKLL